jgi:Transcription factor WhiB
MEPGILTTSMPTLFNKLGLDEQDVKWYHLAACKNMPINWFYDDYEIDKELAKQVDQICMHCPVIKQCYLEGIKNKEKGVRGGVYMDLGRPDKQHNSHKTTEMWKQLKKFHGKN